MEILWAIGILVIVLCYFIPELVALSDDFIRLIVGNFKSKL